MHVWSKLSAAKFADAWEERFPASDEATLVITSAPGKDSIRVEVYCPAASHARALQKELGGSVRHLKPQNWAALSSKAPPPVKVRQTFVICAARTDVEVAKARKAFPKREIIAVPADMAFGTGHHATTATVLRLIVDAAKTLNQRGRPWSLADIGCGSGILAIAAEKLGAGRVWGCDFDPAAVRISKENASRNHTPKARFTKVDVLNWQPKQTWDIVAANIFHDVLEAAFPQLVHSIAPGGMLLLSGILRSQAKGCLDAGKRAGLKIEKVVTRGKWVTAVARLI
jgi:ribosomal protein L11 methyltransferase